jgi:hypothetical protein
MNNFIAMYRYHDTFYTGTLIQPNTLSLFIKKEKDADFLICNAEPAANIIGKCAPIVGSFSGIGRVVKAVKAIFENLSKSDISEPNALWNSFKNLFRGIAEFCSFSGIFLIIFDSVRNSVSIHAKIAKEIQNQENIAGIAIAGKVIFTIDLTQLENFTKIKPISDKHRLAIFKELSLVFLKKQEQKGSSLKMTEIFPKIKEAIEKK